MSEVRCQKSEKFLSIICNPNSIVCDLMTRFALIKNMMYSKFPMKKLLLFSLLLFITPSIVFAAESSVQVSTTGDSNVSVNSESQGQTTTCINGECTTTGGGGKTTVCINGKCQETSGDVNIEENNGNIKVNIKSSTGNNTNSNKGSTPTENTPTPDDEDDNATESADEDEEKENRTLIQIVVGIVSGVVSVIFKIF